MSVLSVSILIMYCFVLPILFTELIVGNASNIVGIVCFVCESIPRMMLGTKQRSSMADQDTYIMGVVTQYFFLIYICNNFLLSVALYKILFIFRCNFFFLFYDKMSFSIFLKYFFSVFRYNLFSFFALILFRTTVIVLKRGHKDVSTTSITRRC